jgi:hypothetical protein
MIVALPALVLAQGLKPVANMCTNPLCAFRNGFLSVVLHRITPSERHHDSRYRVDCVVCREPDTAVKIFRAFRSIRRTA